MAKSKFTTCFRPALVISLTALTAALGTAQQGHAEDRPWELLVCGSYSGYFTLTAVAKEFEKIHGFEPKVAGNPNPVGFRHLASKGYDVMAFSDTLPHKLDQFRTEYFPEDGPQPRRFLLGQYAVVVLVHPSNPVRTMTYEQLEKVFIGEAPRWKAVEGGTGREVLLVGPKETQKAPAIFRRQVLNYKEFPRSMQRLDSGPQIAAYVAKNPGAIGFALLEQEPFENVRMISITKGEGEPIVPPRMDKIFSHEYPLVEDLFLYTHPELNPMSDAFAEFACGPECVQIAHDNWMFAGYDLIAADAKKRQEIVRSGKAPTVSVKGVAGGRQLLELMAHSFVFYEQPIAIGYQVADPSNLTTENSHTDFILVDKNASQQDEPGVELGRRTLGVIIHPDNDLEEFLVSDLKMIYEGRLTKWPGRDVSFKMIGPASDSSAMDLFQNLIGVERRQVAYEAKANTEEIIKAVERDKAAIGIVDLSQYPKETTAVRLVPMTIAGKKAQPIVAGEPVPAGYPLARTYTLHASQHAKPEAKAFLRFITPSRLNEVLAPHGLVTPPVINTWDNKKPDDGEELSHK